MRVLIASPFTLPHVGGVEFYVDWMAGTLRERGHEVRLVAGARPSGADLVVPSVTPWGGSAATVPLAVPTRRAHRALRRLTRWADCVVIHNCFYTLSLIAARAAHAERRPAITVVHANSNVLPGMGHPTRILSNAYARSAGKWQLAVAPPVAISASTSRFLAASGTPAIERLTFPLGDLPPRRYPAMPNTEQPVQIVWAGRLAEAKDPLAAIRVVERVRRGFDVRLHIFGDGPLAHQLPERAWVIRHGSVPRDEVVRAQASAAIAFSTSVADNVQTTVLEAAAIGVPVVATDVGEVRDYLPGNLARLIYDPGNEEQAAMALATTIASLPASEALARANAPRLKRAHDPGVAGRQLEALLLRLALTGAAGGSRT